MTGVFSEAVYFQGWVMLQFLKKRSSLPGLREFKLEAYSIGFSLDRIGPGVDNVRCDVHLSPTLKLAASRIAYHLIAVDAGLDRSDKKGKARKWAREVDNFKQLYAEVMTDAVNSAKAERNIQIDYLAQTAMVKMLLEEVKKQYQKLVGRCKSEVRKSDLGRHQDQKAASKLKERLAHILQNRDLLIRNAGSTLCGYLIDVQKERIREMREAVFGRDPQFLHDILRNPILHVENPFNDFFMIEEYDISLGRRIEDPDKYDALLGVMRDLFVQLDLGAKNQSGFFAGKTKSASAFAGRPSGKKDPASYTRRLDRWIQQPKNIDLLLNVEHSKNLLKEKKGLKAGKQALQEIKKNIKNQKKLVRYFYATLKRAGIIDRFAASYEMQPVYLDYCPPLAPQQILQYLILPKTRKLVKNRLKQLKKLYGKSFSLRPLQNKIVKLEEMSTQKKKEYMLRFIRSFCQYHRDLCGFDTFREAMDRVNLVTDDKIIALSRANNTLHGFYLSHEQKLGNKPIINHTIIKADVRGSTDITFKMKAKGLNPASYFSLNFFDPISEILSEYGAHKVFIEGDAIILSIFERDKTPGNWYSVARSCGIAINMLLIIQRYNEKSRHYKLPILELGIGISHKREAPTFLFDGDNRIMISSAINLADRLSGCTKSVRKIIRKNTSPFNLFVFQTATDEEIAKTADDLSMRYNVNGIELNEAGFKKLSREIDLKTHYGDIPDLELEKVKLHTGKFPTKSGKYQKLVIREAKIPIVDPSNLRQIRFTKRRYYEVCASSKLFRLARKLK